MWPSRLASLLGTSADIRAKLGDAAGALEDHDRAVSLLEDLVARFPDDATHLQRLGIGYAQRSSAFEGAADSAAALADMHRAVDCLERLVKARPTDAQAQANLAAALGNSVELLLRAGDEEQAWAAIQRALELARATRSRGGPGNLIELLSLAGRVAAGRGDAVAAAASIQESLDVARAWWQAEPEDPGRAFNVAHMALNAASHFIDEARHDEARALLEEALSAARLALPGGPTQTAQIMAIVHMELAHLADVAGDEESAGAHLSAARTEAGLSDDNQAQWLGANRRLLELYERLR